MSDILSAVLPHVYDIALTVLVALVSWAAAEVARRLRAATISEARRAILESATSAVTTAVLAVAQTVVEGLKAKSADGKLTSDEAREALWLAVSMARERLGAAGVAELARHVDDVDGWLSATVEAALAAKKGK